MRVPFVPAGIVAETRSWPPLLKMPPPCTSYRPFVPSSKYPKPLTRRLPFAVKVQPSDVELFPECPTVVEEPAKLAAGLPEAGLAEKTLTLSTNGPTWTPSTLVNVSVGIVEVELSMVE